MDTILNGVSSVVTSIATAITSAFTSLSPIFYSGESGLTLWGWLAVAGLGISIVTAVLAFTFRLIGRLSFRRGR